LQFERIQREAAAGCGLSQAFLLHWETVFNLCDRLRRISPPERAPDFDSSREHFWRAGPHS
jgi:hypothetical protein